MDAPRRPLGLFLAGGGAHGAWQAAVIEQFHKAGIVFDKVMGFSIGAFNAASVAFDRIEPSIARWRSLDGGIVKFRPRLTPHFSLLSDEVLHGLFEEAKDDAAARALIRRPLCVIGCVPAEGSAEYAVFAPGGPWHGPLEAWLRASAAIPAVFPPVRIGAKTYIDGGVPMPSPMRFDFFADCAEVWVVEMVRADELGKRFLNPYYGLDQGGREGARAIIDEGVASLAHRPNPPIVRRLCPSRRLDTVMLDFSGKAVRPMFELGERDAKAFLA